jgi:branched-chain amino acid transport system permease protein
VVYALFGGVGTLIGPVLGVVAIEFVSFWLADNFPEIWPIILGLLLLLLILFQPAGLMGLLVPESERVGRFGRPRSPPRRADTGADDDTS